MVADEGGRQESRRAWARGRVAAGVLAAAGAWLAAGDAGAQQAVVSIHFDDAIADHATGARMMEDRGYRATFWLNSKTIGGSGKLSRSQLLALQSAGHEMAGHGATHSDVTQMSSSQAQAEVCGDRTTLLNWGFDVRHFAWPYGAWDAEAKALVQSCGYASARDFGGVDSPSACSGCAWTETIPPADKWAIRTVDGVRAATTLAQMQARVTNAESHGGGLVTFVIHGMCENCGYWNFSPRVFGQFLDWLKARGTPVRTWRQALDGAAPAPTPTPTPTPEPTPTPTPPPSGSNLVVNASLEDGSTTEPICWERSSWGTSTATWTRVTDAHSGAAAYELNMSSWSNGDRKLIVRRTDACLPKVSVGARYEASAWYKGGAGAFLVAFYRNSSGSWVYWTDGTTQTASSTWRQVKLVLPPVPSGATGVSFGLAMTRTGRVSMDDFALVPAP